MSTRSRVLSMSSAVLGLACASTSPPPVAPGETSEPPGSTAEAEQPASDTKDPGRGNVAISDEIRSACGIDETDAYFAYDSARISSQAHRTLNKLADCFARGPLAGRSMRLVGHTDPRGGEEYNMALGERRAESVATTLERFGVSSNTMSTTSRGEIDAKGTNPATWAEDRRVDVMLGS